MANEPRWASALCLVWLQLLAAWLVLSCESARTEPTGGETHFLQACDVDDACGAGLSCLCGLCTLPCSEASDCAELPAASCVAATSSSACASAGSAQCDATCEADADCGQLSRTHRCVAGRCRAGAEDGPACAAQNPAASELIVIGDSFFALSHDITASLEDLARQSGALAAGESYRDYSNLLSNTLAFQGSGIEDQYVQASSEGPVRVVVMNGGGADLLVGSCESLTPDCPLVTDAVDAAAVLFERMAADGVEHVVYAFYPDPLEQQLREAVDVLRPLMQSACQQSPVACHWLDLRPTFEGNAESYVAADGHDPTPEGSRASAEAIWQTLQRACSAP